MLDGLFSKKRIVFILIFGVIALIAYQINFSAILGVEKQYFTFFQFIGPITGAFLGPAFGVMAVLFTEILNFFIKGTELSLFGLLRFLPMLFAVYYFGAVKKKDLIVVIPLICMALFVLHPVGNKAWFYSLYWLIPVIAWFFKKNLFLKSLGTTFTAHAVGSTLFLYSFPMSPEFWIALIPIVAFERIMFALGISVSFVLFNTVLSKVEAFIPSEVVHVNPKYVLSKRFFRLSA